MDMLEYLINLIAHMYDVLSAWAIANPFLAIGIGVAFVAFVVVDEVRTQRRERQRAADQTH